MAIARILGYWTGKIAVWTVFLTLLWLSVAHAETHVIKNDGGGSLVAYINKYGSWAINKDDVRIEGECDSACTIMLGMLPIEKICATRNAEFGFHSASELNMQTGASTYYEPGTQALWYFYSEDERTRRVIQRHGWLGPSNHPKLLMIDAQEIVRPCTEADYVKKLDGGSGQTIP